MQKNNRKIRLYIRNYKFHSIFVKNMLLILLCIFIPLAGSFGVTVHFYENIRQKELAIYHEKLATQVATNVEQILREVKEKVIILEADQDITLFFLDNEVEKEKFYGLKNIAKLLSFLENPIDCVESIYLYSPISNSVISSRGLHTYDEFYDPICLEAFKTGEDSFQIKYIDATVKLRPRKVISVYYRQTVGAIADKRIIINLDAEKMIKEIVNEQDILFDIFYRDQMVFSNDPIRMQNVDNGQDITDLQQIVKHPLEEMNMEIALQMQYSGMEMESTNLQKVLYVSSAFILLLTILVVFYLSVEIFNPFAQIMEKMEKNNFPEISEKKLLRGENELSYILRAVETTLNQRSDIEQELSERVELLKKAQAVALQSQINPHFMNNTLDCMNWIAVNKLGEKNDISEIAYSLSQMLRMALEDTDTVVTLKEEILHAQIYLRIQQICHQNKLNVVWDIPEELLNCKMLRLTLQPLIENAIVHGIEPFGDAGDIRIQAIREDKTVRITVGDSGFGLSKAEIDELYYMINQERIKESHHIGLSNVNQRLQLTFGKEYGIVISSQIGWGTEVSFLVPYDS